MDKLDPMQNQLCRVCDEPAAGFHFGAFTCEGCKSFFGRTSNNQSVIQECKNNYRCVINKKNRTTCKACRLRKCLMVGMSKSGSRYGRRSNWFKIHCLMQQAASHRQSAGGLSLPFEPTAPGAPGGPSPTSALARASHPATSPSTDPRKNETKATKPIAPLWRPLEPSSPPSDSDRKSPADKPANDSKFAFTSSFLQSANSHNHSHSLMSSIPQSRSPLVVPDLNQLFRLQSSYNLAGLAAPEVTREKEESEEIGQFSPLAMAAAAAALNAANSSARFPHLYPAGVGSNPLGFLPPTFNIPALSALPLHKQMLLSPLLASSHLWASARKAFPFPQPPTSMPTTSTTTTTEVEKALAEHKALLERFRSSFASQHHLPATSKSSVSNIDLAATSDDESSSMTGGTMPHLSDTDDDDIVDDAESRSKRREETPLDLTCV